MTYGIYLTIFEEVKDKKDKMQYLFLQYVRVHSLVVILILFTYSMLLSAYFNEGIMPVDFPDYLTSKEGAFQYSVIYILLSCWVMFVPAVLYCKNKRGEYCKYLHIKTAVEGNTNFIFTSIYKDAT